MKLAGRTGLTRHRSPIWVPKLSASSRPGLAASARPPKPRRPAADGASRGGNGSSNVGSVANVQQPARPQGRDHEEPDAIAFLNTTLFLIGLILVEYGVRHLCRDVIAPAQPACPVLGSLT